MYILLFCVNLLPLWSLVLQSSQIFVFFFLLFDVYEDHRTPQVGFGGVAERGWPQPRPPGMAVSQHIPSTRAHSQNTQGCEGDLRAVSCLQSIPEGKGSSGNAAGKASSASSSTRGCLQLRWGFWWIPCSAAGRALQLQVCLLPGKLVFMPSHLVEPAMHDCNEWWPD